MNRVNFKSIMMGLGAFLIAQIGMAGAVETVSLGGVAANFTTADGITAAAAAVDNGGVVRILEGGTYTTTTLVGGKTYTVEATVDNVVVYGAPAITMGAAAGPTHITLKDLRLYNNEVASDGRAVLLVQQDATNAVTVSLDNTDIVQGVASTGANARAMTVQIASAAGAAVTVNTTSCSLLGTTGNGLLIAGSSANLTGFTANLTDSVFKSNTNAAVFSQAGDSQTWNLNQCEFDAGTRAFQAASTHSNSNFNFIACTLKGRSEIVHVDRNSETANFSDNNHWVFNRSFISRGDYAAAGSNNRLTLFEYSDDSPTGHVVDIINTVVVTEYKNNTAYSRCFYSGTDGGKIQFNAYYSTFLCNDATREGHTAANNHSSSTRVPGNYFNNVFLNLSAPVSATVGQAGNNLIVGTADQANLNATFVTAAAGLPNALTAGLFDAEYIPLAGSPAIDAADTSATLLALAGGVDHRNLPRQAGAPDIGAFEFGASSAPNRVRNWIVFE